MRQMPESSGIIILLLVSPFMIIGGLVMGEVSIAGVGALLLVVALLRMSQIKNRR